MRIRSITVGQRQGWPLRAEGITQAGSFLKLAKTVFEQAGYEVQTVRLATQPLASLLGKSPAKDAIDLARGIEAETARHGIDYCSIGPILAAEPEEGMALIEQIPGILGNTTRIFTSVMPATSAEGVNLRAIKATADVLVEIARGDEEGARPRRLTVSANVPPHGPFFPSAYHHGRKTGFSIATEAADLAVEAFTRAGTLEEARKGLLSRLGHHGGRIQRMGAELAEESGFAFHGLDICLAPYPEDSRSIGQALERLGGGHFGTHGTLFAAAFVTGLLGQAPLRKCGFSGLMIPLLEDSVLARRYAEGAYTLDSLLLYSAVCGAGLDTIPIPGDATAEQIASVYLDMCTLSVTLGKPLTARLMPLAGKKAGDPVRFAFPYFAPTRVVALNGPGSGALFRKGAWVRSLGKRG